MPTSTPEILLAHSLDREIDRLREILWSARDPQGRAFASLADAYRRRGDLPLARTMITEGLERLPGFSSAHVVAGWIHRDLASPVEADRSFRRVLELDPENAMALQGLGELAEERGSHAEAAEFFRRLSHVAPTSDGDTGSNGHGDGPVAVSPGHVHGGDDADAARVGIEDLSPDQEGDRAADDAGPTTAPASRLGAVPVQSLFPDAVDDGSVAPGQPEDDSSWAAGDGDESARTVSVGDLAPDDDSFDFAVADLGDEVDPDAAPQTREETPDAVAGWGLLEEDETVDAAFGSLTDASEETSAEAAREGAPGIDVSSTESAPDWSWSPAVDEDEAPDAAAPATEDDTGAPSREGVEAQPGGPSRDDAVPIASLAPDGRAAPPAHAVDDPGSATPVGELAPDDRASQAPATPMDAAEAAADDDGTDDFQAWLERNSI